MNTTPTIEPGKGPRILKQEIEYRAREVKRYIITRYEGILTEEGGGQTSSQTYGEFDNFHSADRVGRLCAMGERSSAWDQAEIKFTDTFSTTIRLNTDGTIEEIK